jgi:hypothetical protein
MENEYDIDSLIKRFKIHLEYSVAEKKKQDDEYREKYAKEPPRYGPDPDFQITKALISMCEEIKKLRDSISHDII